MSDKSEEFHGVNKSAGSDRNKLNFKSKNSVLDRFISTSNVGASDLAVSTTKNENNHNNNNNNNAKNYNNHNTATNTNTNNIITTSRSSNESNEVNINYQNINDDTRDDENYFPRKHLSTSPTKPVKISAAVIQTDKKLYPSNFFVLNTTHTTPTKISTLARTESPTQVCTAMTPMDPQRVTEIYSEDKLKTPHSTEVILYNELKDSGADSNFKQGTLKSTIRSVHSADESKKKRKRFVDFNLPHTDIPLLCYGSSEIWKKESNEQSQVQSNIQCQGQSESNEQGQSEDEGQVQGKGQGQSESKGWGEEQGKAQGAESGQRKGGNEDQGWRQGRCVHQTLDDDEIDSETRVEGKGDESQSRRKSIIGCSCRGEDCIHVNGSRDRTDRTDRGRNKQRDYENRNENKNENKNDSNNIDIDFNSTDNSDSNNNNNNDINNNKNINNDNDKSRLVSCNSFILENNGKINSSFHADTVTENSLIDMTAINSQGTNNLTPYKIYESKGKTRIFPCSTPIGFSEEKKREFREEFLKYIPERMRDEILAEMLRDEEEKNMKGMKYKSGYENIDFCSRISSSNNTDNSDDRIRELNKHDKEQQQQQHYQDQNKKSQQQQQLNLKQKQGRKQQVHCNLQ